MKQLLTDLQKDIPHIKDSLLAALGNVQPRHLLDPYISKKENHI
jgi:tRNA 2-thiocytidine biosynthesis protein TtcA